MLCYGVLMTDTDSDFTTTTDSGQTATLFVKITGPEGVTLANSGQGGTFDFDGKSSKYTYKISTVFENETKPVQPTVWKPTEQLKPGKYTIEIYAEGYKMGSTVLDLK